MGRRRRALPDATLSGFDYDLYLGEPEAIERASGSGEAPRPGAFSDQGLDDLAASWGRTFSPDDKAELRSILKEYLIGLEAEDRAVTDERALGHIARIRAAVDTLAAAIEPAPSDDAATVAMARLAPRFLDQQAMALGRGVFTPNEVWQMLQRLGEAALLAGRDLEAAASDSEWSRGAAESWLLFSLWRFGKARGFPVTASENADEQSPGPFLMFLKDLRARLRVTGPQEWRFCANAAAGSIAKAVHRSQHRWEPRDTLN
jgi:hypothetical protein